MISSFNYFKRPNNITNSLLKYKSKDPNYWEDRGKAKALSLTNFTISNVPAYEKFLRSQKKHIAKITSLQEFKKLPFTSKNDYLKKSIYRDLFPKNAISKVTTVSSTSGSTGKPFYFPRGEEQDAQYEFVAELFLKNQFEIDKKTTLAINGFGLGIWIGGIFTYKNFNQLARKGYKIAVAPVGTNKEIFLTTFREMAPYWDQVILMGYPPFIKDCIDEGAGSGIDWKKHNIKILTATEGFTEKFRDYIAEKAGVKNIYTDILNIYGSVELGTMSHETPLTTLIRKIAVDNNKVWDELFPGASVIPTLVQYHPGLVYFEEVGGEVIATGYGSSFPLIRYKFSDKGGVISFNEMVSRLSSIGIDIEKEANKAGIEKYIFKLPFVYTYERSDFVVVVRGANIYPGNIRSALQEKAITGIVTGKFTMQKKEDKNLNEYLKIFIELKKNAKNTSANEKKIYDTLIKTLCSENSEFNYLFTTEGKQVAPAIELLNYEHPEYFPPGKIKQKWIKK